MLGLRGTLKAKASISHLVVYALFPATSFCYSTGSVFGVEISPRRDTWTKREDTNTMRRRPARDLRRNCSTRRGFSFEPLEQRLVFSVTGFELPWLQKPGLEGDAGLASSAESLRPQSDVPLSNFEFLPMVYAGPDAAAKTQQNLQLAGEVLVNSTSNLQVQWRLLSGPGAATFSDATAVGATVQFSTAGDYELELQATNGGITATDRLLVSVTEAQATPAVPELPRQTVDTTFTLPSGGTTHYVRAGDNLQAALDLAQPGDLIELQAGATFTGPFTLRPKQGDGWIYITSNRLEDLPTSGERVSPADASNMPKLVVNNPSQSVLIIEKGAKNFRLTGIEIATTYAERTAVQYGIVLVGFGGASPDVADNIIIDRCYIHGTPTGNNRDGIVAYEVSNFAVIDSHISDFHAAGYESHGIHIFVSQGPTKIANNHIEAAGINLFVGDNSIGSAMPSDIEIIGNLLTKPWSWNSERPEFSGINWTVKNVLELKAASRVLIDGNVLERSWAAGQVGGILTVTPRGGSISDLTITNNVFRDAASGAYFNPTDASLKRVVFDNNLLYRLTSHFIGIASPDGIKQVEDIAIRHNTGIHTATGRAFLQLFGGHAALMNAEVRDNLFTFGTYGMSTSGTPGGSAGWDIWAINSKFFNNAMVGADYLTKTFFKNTASFYDHLWISTTQDIAFASQNATAASAADFALSELSPLKGGASDGTDVGANIEQLLLRIPSTNNP